MFDSRSPITILLADDDADDRMLIRDALFESRIANEFREVEDGVELLDYLHQRGNYTDRTQYPMPGLILLDLNMPRKDGREALREIKSDPFLRMIPVIVLTTSKAEEDIYRTYDLGVSSFITKPVSFDALVDIMKTLGKYWFEIVALPHKRQAHVSLMATSEHVSPRTRLLLIDDDEDAFVLTRDMLRDFVEKHYSVEWVSTYDDGRAALIGNAYDLYIVDYMLGSRNGLELIEDARAAGCAKPIIFMTGMENHTVDVLAMNMGASDYLVKGDITPRLLERSIRYTIGHYSDMEALRRSTEELRVLNEQLIKSEQDLQEINASKDRFFSIIAHDLRSPFVSLLGFSELLKDGASSMPTEEIRQCADMLHESGKHLYRLLENLLHWSRIQTGRLVIQPTSVGVQDIAGQVAALFAPAAEAKSISIAVDIEGSFHVFSDPHLLSTILENLVSNAIKFTERHGRVVVSATADGDLAWIEIRDNGIGMSASTIEKLFRIEKNHSSHGTEKETGTGLGLIICKELIMKAGGTIEVDSTPGVGSTFRFSVPLATAALITASFSGTSQQITELPAHTPAGQAGGV